MFSEKIKAKPELVPPHPVNTTVPYGESALFQCKVKSAVHPHIQVHILRYFFLLLLLLLFLKFFLLLLFFAAGIFVDIYHCQYTPSNI